MNIAENPQSGRLSPGARTSLLVICLFQSYAIALPQVSTKIGSIAPAETNSNVPVTVMAELQQGEIIEHVYIVYRPFGESGYIRKEMDLTGNTASVVLPPKVIVPPFVEYYIVLVDRTGKLETYPLSETDNPFSNPPERTLRLNVHPGTQDDAQIIFLSPEPSTVLSADDVLISVSLLRADSVVVRRATQIFLDGADVTTDAVFSDDIIVYAPDNLALRLGPGIHKVMVSLFNRDGILHRSAGLTFTVRGEGKLSAGEPSSREFKYGVSLQYESRYEQVSNTRTWYNRGNYQFTGNSGAWRFVSNGFLTSDESGDRQPQNRFFAGVESPWLRVGYGDGYPSFPDLVLSGKRVRGLSSSLNLGIFNVDLTVGTTIRAIEGSLLKGPFPIDSLVAEQQRDPTAAYGQIDSLHWGKFSYGTYGRNLFAIRPSFGSGETWQVGFTWLRSKDDVSSIRYGTRPQENVVVGIDFLSRFDNSRIEFSGQGAFSAYNSDISSGNFTDAYIDSVYKNEADLVKKARDLLSPFITVNDNLRPLSFKKFSTLAYDLSLGLRYFDNVVRLKYLFHGSDYNSFGQSFLRKDIRGFNVVDRMRIISSQVFATLGYERLTDNISDTKVATTVFSNINAAISYYPAGNAPGITVGVARFASDNSLPITGPDSLGAVSDVTNRYFVQTSYDFRLGARHAAVLNFSTSDRTDFTVRRSDVRNTTLSLGLNTRYRIPLQTDVDFSLNLNELPSSSSPGDRQKINYTTFGVRARYELMKDRLTFSATFSPTSGDFQRTVIDLGAQFYLLPTMSFMLQFTSFHTPGISNDSFLSLRYRYDV